MAKPAFDCAHVGFEYSGLIAEWVQRYKHVGDLTIGRLLAQLLSKTLKASVTQWPQAVVSVPTPMRRRLWRGMDHAEQLALDVARLCGALPYQPWLVTTRTTALQSKQSDAERWTNVSHAFAVKTPKRDRQSLPQSVALVDDVMVSGATAHYAALALKQAGIASVQVWVVARVCPDR
jgi:ComF family protein